MEADMAHSKQDNDGQSDLLSLYSRLLQLDEAGVRAGAVFYRLARLCGGDSEVGGRQCLVGSLGEGGWSSHLLPDDVIELEMDVLSKYVTDVTLDGLQTAAGHYVIPEDQLPPRLLATVCEAQGRAEGYRRRGRCDYLDTMSPEAHRRLGQNQGVFDRMADMFSSVVSGGVQGRDPLDFILNCASTLTQACSQSTADTMCTPTQRDCFLKMKTSMGTIKLCKKLKGPAETSVLVLEGSRLGADVQFSKDDVIALELTQLPPDLQRHVDAWAARRKHSPSPEVIAEARRQTCLLVPKRHKQKSGPLPPVQPQHTEWVPTMILAENVIMRARSRSQQLVHLMAKCLYYLYLRPSEDSQEEVSSYVLKTAMLYLQEDIPEDAWREDRVFLLLEELLGRVEAAVKAGHMAQYVFTHVNILADVSDDTRRSFTARLRDIRANLLHYLRMSAAHVQRVLQFEDMTVIEECARRLDRKLDGLTELSPLRAFAIFFELLASINTQPALQPTAAPEHSAIQDGGGVAAVTSARPQSPSDATSGSHGDKQVPRNSRRRGRDRRRNIGGSSEGLKNICQVMTGVLGDLVKRSRTTQGTYAEDDLD